MEGEGARSIPRAPVLSLRHCMYMYKLFTLRSCRPFAVLSADGRALRCRPVKHALVLRCGDTPCPTRVCDQCLLQHISLGTKFSRIEGGTSEFDWAGGRRRKATSTMAVLLRGSLRAFSAWGERNPSALNVMAATTLGGAGDVGAQLIEGADGLGVLDAKRTACVCAWYAPAALFFWTPFMGGVERTFGTSGAKSVAAKVLCYNLAISTVDITGFHLVSLTPQVGAEKAVQTLREGYADAVAAGCSLWVPAMTLIFWRVPAHLRLSTSYALDVCWASTMSFLSNRRKNLVEAAPPPAPAWSGKLGVRKSVID